MGQEEKADVLFSFAFLFFLMDIRIRYADHD
jgi:hypothetical protein